MTDTATTTLPRALNGQPTAQFEYRVIRDAYLDATTTYWERRARTLEAARPRAGDFTGRATRLELRAQWDRLTAAADACRHRAAFIDATTTELDDALVDIGRGAVA